ncbi:MAG: peptidoglycan-N-acetylglucosamine deacetylase, partial [Thermoleophilaceae bacterium]|nr:peptidoglycan-N-acetylglucosamine deacetylase [Thermoleophilaceae bacterium]
MTRPLIATATVAAAAWSLPALAPIATPAARALDVPRRLSSGDAVAVTFDDGPHPEGTPAALEALAIAGALATFFMV